MEIASASNEQVNSQLLMIDLGKKFNGDTENCIKCPECDAWAKNAKGLRIHFARSHKGKELPKD